VDSPTDASRIERTGIETGGWLVSDNVETQSGSDEAFWSSPAAIDHVQILLNSFAHLVKRELIPRKRSAYDQARALFEAPFVVVSHGTQADPILNYGNRTALRLWEMTIEQLTQTPSRLTAEPVHREERARLMERTAREGYVDDYKGIRISSSGRRFRIDQAIVWNLLDAHGQRVGQAATFSDWMFLEE
jgi:hypothetical protein